MTPTRNHTAAATARLMNLNLRFGLAEDGPNNWRFRSRAYPALLAKYPCDFYAFQEANGFQIDFLAGLLEGYDCIGRRSPAPDRWQNNVIFFHRRWRCTLDRHIYLSDTPHIESKYADSRWPRQCTLGKFVCSDRKVTCVTTHFDFDADVQRRSALLIRQQINKISNNDPVLLAGDFNCAPGSACYTAFTDRNAAPGPEFSNAFDPPPYAGTYHGFSGTGDAPPIDWILYRGEIEIHGAQVIEQAFDGFYPSDHFPLLAEFVWPNPMDTPV
ncbi:MAG: endonuclease/exonuclease/phosphatase family protein [Desulfobacteraceae bacterium]|jgi:endonuclease/exonuclease/phosphatase family metal-dependent hydrolase